MSLSAYDPALDSQLRDISLTCVEFNVPIVRTTNKNVVLCCKDESEASFIMKMLRTGLTRHRCLAKPGNHSTNWYVNVGLAY